MKKTITSVLLSFSILSVSALWANTDLNGKSLLLKKRNLHKSNILDSKRLSNVSDKGDKAFGEGKIVVSLGYGAPNLGKALMVALIDDGTNIKATGIGPIHFRGEIGISNGVGMGISVNYVSFGAKWNTYDNTTGVIPYSNEFSRTSLSVLARFNFHFGTTEKLDPYVGIAAGYKQATWKFTTTDPALVNEQAPGFTPIGFETTIGLRYYIAPGLGIYSEMGIAKSVIQAGIVAAL